MLTMTVASNSGDSRQRRNSFRQNPGRMSISPDEIGGGDDASNVRVVVRLRPENEQELTSGQRVVVRAMDERVLVFDPREEASPDFYHGKIRRGRDITKRKNRDLKFAFDYVFGPHDSNDDVFEQTTKAALDGVLDGYNSSVFAYGATGAGKTHTMLGKSDDQGVTFLTMMDLYKRIDNMKNEKTIEVAVSYLEVYNEQIKDLLLPTGNLPIREDPKLGVVVSGLSLHKPQNAEELMHMLAFGNQNRTQHPTDANAESSRSHAVFQVFIRQRDRTANITADVKVAKMSLIDLAGSERATVTKNMGVRFREGANINRSLLALGNVINALAENKVKSQHVPYRNSKLTRLLKDSLGGNCKTVMIAAVSPSAMSYEDTYNTLKYADRAKHIKAIPKKNVVSVDMHVSRYAQIVDELREEINELKQKVKKYEDGSFVNKRQPTPCSKIVSLQETLYKVFTSRISIRKELLEFESAERDMLWKILRKERSLSRLTIVHSQTGRYSINVERIQQSVQATRNRLSSLICRKETVKERMVGNCDWLKNVEQEMAAPVAERVPEILELNLRMHHLEVELTDSKRYNKYLKKVIKTHEREAQTTERLIGNLLQTVKKQFYLLKGQGMATSDVVEDYESVQRLVDGDREVAWADEKDSPDIASMSSQLSADRLLDFPVLSCVRTTPITPHRLKNGEAVSSPGPASSLYMNTPRPDSSAAVKNTSMQQTPNCAVEKNRTTLRWGSASKIPQSQNPSTHKMCEPNSSTNRRKSIANLNGPKDSGDGLNDCENEDDNDHTVTEFAGQTPAAKVFLVTHPHDVGDNSGNPPGNHSQNAPGKDSLVTSQKAACQAVNRQHVQLDETFVLSEGNSKADTQNALTSKPSNKNVDTYSTNLKNRRNFHEKDQPLSVNSSYVISEYSDCLAGNGGTVTKLNNQTVTKSVPSVPLHSRENLNEGGCSAGKEGKHVNRAIRFSSSTSPVLHKAPLTFADAVKSPGRPPLRSLTENCMSPLAQPLGSPKGDFRNRMIPKSKLALSEVENSPEYAEHFSKMSAVGVKAQQNIETLKRAGLPSVLDRSPAHRAHRVLPGYMQTTKAVASRSRFRTLSYKDNSDNRTRPTVRRETANQPLHIGKSMFRSKSVSSLRRA